MTQNQLDLATIPGLIIELRGERVMLDEDLGRLYGVPTKALLQAVKRNLSRFPADFMFRLTNAEFAHLRSQFVTSSTAAAHGGRRHAPYAFTEQGVAMLSSVLRSARAVQVNVEIMRAFVQLRRFAAGHIELGARLDELERRYDGQLKVVFDAIRQLMAPAAKPRRRIGFDTDDGN